MAGRETPRRAQQALTGAVAAKERVHWWPVEPWFQHHGVPVEQGLSVLAWLGHSERLKNLLSSTWWTRSTTTHGTSTKLAGSTATDSPIFYL